MVEYLSGNRIQGSSTLTTSPPQNSWKEIGRLKITSATEAPIVVRGLDSATSGTMVDKDNLMVLEFIHTSSNTSNDHFLNDDTGNTNYSMRRLSNNAEGAYNKEGSAQPISSGAYNGFGAMDGNRFAISNITNTMPEKYAFLEQIVCSGTGTGTINRGQNVWKWSGNNTDAIQKYGLESGGGSGSGQDTYQANTEIVVLGCDNDNSTSGGDNFWQQVGTKTCDSATDTLDCTVTNKKWYFLQYYVIPSGNVDIACRINGDTSSSEYRKREFDDGGSGSSAASTNLPWGKGSGGAKPCYGYAYLCNISGEEKLWVSSGIDNGGTGNNHVSLRKNVGKWYPSDLTEQITKISLFENGQSGQIGVGSKITVWGAD